MQIIKQLGSLLGPSDFAALLVFYFSVAIFSALYFKKFYQEFGLNILNFMKNYEIFFFPLKNYKLLVLNLIYSFLLITLINIGSEGEILILEILAWVLFISFPFFSLSVQLVLLKTIQPF